MVGLWKLDYTKSGGGFRDTGVCNALFLGQLQVLI
jgi:hypothetical protein